MYVFRCTCVHMDVEARDRVVVYTCFSFLQQSLCWFGIHQLGQADWPVVLRDQPVSTSQYRDHKFMPPPQVASAVASGTQTQTFMFVWQVFHTPALRKNLIDSYVVQNL